MKANYLPYLAGRVFGVALLLGAGIGTHIIRRIA